jgi:hypothetical protein
MQKAPASESGRYNCDGNGGLGFFSEEFDVGWAFLDWRALAALDLFADLFDDVGVGERGDVAGVHVVGDSG